MYCLSYREQQREEKLPLINYNYTWQSGCQTEQGLNVSELSSTKVFIYKEICGSCETVCKAGIQNGKGFSDFTICPHAHLERNLVISKDSMKDNEDGLRSVKALYYSFEFCII